MSPLSVSPIWSRVDDNKEGEKEGEGGGENEGKGKGKGEGKSEEEKSKVGKGKKINEENIFSDVSYSQCFQGF